MAIEVETVKLLTQKERTFLLVNEDFTLQYISHVRPSQPDLRVVEEMAVGSYLTDCVPVARRNAFKLNLKKAFLGRCFSFDVEFLDHTALPKRAVATVTPAQYEGSKVRSVSLSIETREVAEDNLSGSVSHELVGKAWDSVSLGICILDRNGRFAEVNKTFCGMFGRDKEGIIGQRFSGIVQSTQKGILEKLHETYFQAGSISVKEVEVTLVSGERLTLTVSCSPLRSGDGEEFLVATLEDITGIRNLQIQLGTFSSNLHGVVFRYVLYPDGSDRMLYMSAGAEKIYGFNSSEIVADISLIWNSVDPEYLEDFKTAVDQSAKDLQEWNITFKYNHPDGSQRWLQGTGMPQRSEDSSVVWDALVLDVTEKTEAHYRFAKNERLFDSLINDGLELMALLDANGNYLFTSPSYPRKFGFEANELKGAGAFDLIHPDYVEQIKQDFFSVLTQDKHSTKPYLVRKKDGSYFWLRTTGTNLLKDPLINGIVINSVDVTDLILAEQEVKASEAQYKYLFENNPAAMMVWDLQNGMILDANSQCEVLYGYSREEFLAKKVYDIRPPEDAEWIKSLGFSGFANLKEGDKLYVGVSRHVKKTGEVMQVEIDSRIIKYRGKLVSMVLTIDVTEKYKIQEEIKQSEAKYRTIFDVSPLPMYIYRINDIQILDVNERAQQHYGYSREEFLTMTPLDLRPESEAQKFRESYDQTIGNSGSPYRGVFIHKKKSGQPIHVEVTGQQIRFQDAECVMVVLMDVTEKILQEKLDLLERQMMEQTIQEGDSLEDRLEKYLNGIEELFPGIKTSIVKVREGVVKALAAPSLSKKFVQAAGEINLTSMSELGSEPVFFSLEKLSEHHSNPNWITFKKYCERENMNSCYFQPIIDADQALVGAFGVYFSSTQKPEHWMIDHFFRIGNHIGLILENFLKSKELKLSNERYNFVNLATRGALYDYDVRHKELFLGQSYQRLTGYVPDNSTADLTIWRTLVHPNDRLRLADVFEEAVLDITQSLFQAEYRIKLADQTYADVADRGFIVRDDEGKALRIVGVLSDVTERKEFEASLRSLNEKLEAGNKELAISNTELEQFAYVASHDLQEPLRMISSFMGLLEKRYKDKLDEKAQRYIYFAVDGAKRMRQIILDLLEFSMVGRIDEEESDVSLNEVVEYIKSVHRNQLNVGKIAINYSNLPVVRASRTPMLQIFQNLIANGLKYTKVGVVPRVDIAVEDRGDFWEFEVKDNGIGIEGSNHEKIFVIFQRLHTQDKFGGTGIGLSVVKKILENIGGKIWLTSKVDEGTSFYFTLPK